MRRIGLIVVSLTIVIAGVGVAHVATTGAQRLFAQTVLADNPWVGIRGEIECDNEYVTCNVEGGELRFLVDDVQYYDSIAFTIGNAYPGVEFSMRIQVHSKAPGPVVLVRLERTHDWPGDRPCTEIVSWQVNGGAGDNTFDDLESDVLGVPIPSDETLTIELLLTVSADAPQGSVCRVTYVLGISPPDEVDEEEPTPVFAPAAAVGVAGDPPCFFDVDMLGEVTRVYVTCADSRCIRDYEAEDPAGSHFLDLPVGTQVTHDRDGEFHASPPRWLRMRVSDEPPPIPPGMVVLGNVYDFTGFTAPGEPVTAVFFDRQVGMELAYDPDDLPEDITGVGIAYWNPNTRQWELLPQSIGRIAAIGIATADVTHFSTFAVMATIAKPEEPPVTDVPETVAPGAASFVADGLVVQPSMEHFWGALRFLTRVGRTATVAVTIMNTGDAPGTHAADLVLNGETAATQQVTLGGGERQQITFFIEGLARGVHRVQVGGLTTSFTATQQVNWWLIALVACLVLLAVIITIVQVRRRAPHIADGHTQ